ncbi:MAG: hypothetical protein ABR543_12765 [Gemmatimonadaceae bacterium]
MSWTLALLAGATLALLLYRSREPRALGRLTPLILLRALSLSLIAALLLDAPAGTRRARSPIVALDASLSWLREGDTAFWRTAVARARALSSDTILLFGDSVRPPTGARVPSDLPEDRSTEVGSLVERSLGSGRPLTLVTDGEIEDPWSLRSLPAGTRIEVPERAARLDVGVVAVDAPRAMVSGDTIELRATLRAGALPAPSGTLTILAGSRVMAAVPADPLAARNERTETIRIASTLPQGVSVLSAAVSVPGDAERGNDTVSIAVEVSRAAGAVLVSSSPDYDSRFLVPILRGAVALPTRAYFRVAPGMWRQEGSLAPVDEGEVKLAARQAPLVILHGDTAMLGRPRLVTTGALALFPVRHTAGGDAGEWFPVGAPPSPISASLSGIAWDSLPPLGEGTDGPTVAAGGAWEGLVAARARQFDRRAVVIGSSGARRVVIISATGFWRWRFRGGSSADAYATLWGSIFDWLTAERPDDRGAIPADALLRSGDPIRWRRTVAAAGAAGKSAGSGDSVVTIVVRRRGDSAAQSDVSGDSVSLRYGAGGTAAESPPLVPGIYDVSVPGGSIVLAVNASRELLPRAGSVRSGVTGGAPAVGDRLRLRDKGWVYLTVVFALCAEWVLRRRMGLR